MTKNINISILSLIIGILLLTRKKWEWCVD